MKWVLFFFSFYKSNRTKQMDVKQFSPGHAFNTQRTEI